MFESMLKIFVPSEKEGNENCLLKTPSHTVAIVQESVNGEEIELTEEEFDRACMIACRRCRDAYKMGLEDGYVNGREYDAHIQGCLAEFAVAKYFGMLEDWMPTINTFRKLPDMTILNKGIEVKSSGNISEIVRKGFYIKQSTLKRNEEDTFIFVYCDIRQTTKRFTCKIIGWANIQKIKEFYDESRWIFPYNEIENMSSF